MALEFEVTIHQSCLREGSLQGGHDVHVQDPVPATQYQQFRVCYRKLNDMKIKDEANSIMLLIVSVIAQCKLAEEII